ncbi:MAG: hypothetical protein VB124_00935, partial [Burkholderia sp.]
RAPCVAACAPSRMSTFFNISDSSLDDTFYPKSVSRKTGAAAQVTNQDYFGDTAALSSPVSSDSMQAASAVEAAGPSHRHHKRPCQHGNFDRFRDCFPCCRKG